MNDLFLGWRANKKPLVLSREERATHMHVIGSSGSGKSKFLEWMIRGDIRNRQGLCLIDPHGVLYDDIVRWCAYRGYTNSREIVLLNLSVPDMIVGFNPFQRIPEGDLSVQVDNRVTATMHAWNVENTDRTPTLARTLSLIYTVMLEHRLGLSQVQHLLDFNAKSVQQFLINRLQTPLIQKEWRELQALKAKDWRDEMVSAKNRLFKLVISEGLKRFMGLPGRSINLKEIIDQGKILLVNLKRSKYLSEEGARTFGALLVNELFEVALQREKDQFRKDPKPFYLYVDEFQNFISLDLANMLDQVRKFGLFLVLAHQRCGHLEQDILDAALTNCQIRAVFGGLPVLNARQMAEEMFISQLDPKKIKVAIYQTKFWPTYSRDKVYSRGRTHTASDGVIQGAAIGQSSMTANSSYFLPEDWIGSADLTGTMQAMSSGETSISSSGSVHAESAGETETEADIPILLPVPFQELSSIQYYTPEEQLIELTAALKRQFPRHCFIQIRQQETQPLLVPFVKDYYLSPRVLKEYQTKLFTKGHGLSQVEADLLIEETERNLLEEIERSSKSDSAAGVNSWDKPPQTANKPSRATRQKSKGKSPLEKVADEVIGRE